MPVPATVSFSAKSSASYRSVGVDSGVAGELWLETITSVTTGPRAFIVIPTGYALGLELQQLDGVALDLAIEHRLRGFPRRAVVM